MQDCTASLRMKSRFVPAQVTRAQAYHGLGRYRESLADLEHVIAFGPGGFTPGEQAYYHALNQRAWLRATCPDPAFRNAERALADAKIACTATLWKNSSYLDTIAAAYANAGDFPNAIRIRSARSRLGVSARRRPAMCSVVSRFTKAPSLFGTFAVRAR